MFPYLEEEEEEEEEEGEEEVPFFTIHFTSPYFIVRILYPDRSP